MNELNPRITEFLHKHHVLTLATCSDNLPWCANCFYVWIEEEAGFVFTSDDTTKHIQDLLQGNNVAGSVVLETETIGKIRGIQFRGRLSKPEGELAKRSKKSYLKRFPYAMLMQTNIWLLEVDYIKMTDNRLGFGKKLIWERGK
ncbi:MAG: pyridoxamine 5'-phosphate oxidase family protein [Bacteroidales bacterium]|nr:pyridoxamine 5'-phosphate oxidase family protein [Bacteroidales bacterium]MCF8389123.1 pyridoxamine 5'-phosphate oxidase family protein [Bacteroidales bacterium]